MLLAKRAPQNIDDCNLEWVAHTMSMCQCAFFFETAATIYIVIFREKKSIDLVVIQEQFFDGKFYFVESNRNELMQWKWREIEFNGNENIFTSARFVFACMHIAHYTKSSCEIDLTRTEPFYWIANASHSKVFEITEQLKHDIKHDKMECAMYAGSQAYTPLNTYSLPYTFKEQKMSLCTQIAHNLEKFHLSAV